MEYYKEPELSKVGSLIAFLAMVVLAVAAFTLL